MIVKKTNKRIRKNKKIKKTRKRGRTNNKKTKGIGGTKDPNDKSTNDKLTNDKPTNDKPTNDEQINNQFLKRLMKINVTIEEGKDKTDKDNRKIDFNVRTFHDFYGYLNETDIYLKKILTDELLAFTDPLKYKTNQDELKKRTKNYPYVFGYKENEKVKKRR